MSALAVAGIVIAIAACVVLVCTVAFLLWREGKRPLSNPYDTPFGDVPRLSPEQAARGAAVSERRNVDHLRGGRAR